MIMVRKRKIVKNKKGSILLGVLVALGLTALFLGISSGVTGAMNKGKITKTHSELRLYADSIEQVIMDNPNIGANVGATAETTFNGNIMKPADPVATTKAIVDLVNANLDEAFALTDNGESIKNDPWNAKYRLYYVFNDLDINVDDASGATVVTSKNGTGKDTEYRIIIVSGGKNGKIGVDPTKFEADGTKNWVDCSAADTLTLDEDDMIYVCQYVNGGVKSGASLDGTSLDSGVIFSKVLNDASIVPKGEGRTLNDALAY